MNCVLLSNVTVQPLVAFLKPIDVTLGEYNSLILDLVDPSSRAADPAVTHVFCIFDTDAMFGEAFFDPGAASPADSYLAALDAFCAAHPQKVVVTNSFCAGTARPLTFADVISGDSVKALEARLNARLIDMARARTNLLLVDVEMLVRRYGEEALVSRAFWYTARIPYTSLMFRALADALKQALTAYGNRARKLLILDLDNTLWGGIVGELGPTGIVLSEDGPGAIYRDFQRHVKALKDTGVLLAICSKNNLADVEEVFEANPMMVLKRDDFVCVRVNWKPKPENIVEIAETLSLGIDSFVFVDDNPVERALIAQSLPEVAVPRFPDRPETLPRWFVDDVVRPYFPKYRVLREDVEKTHQYRAQAARQEFAAQFDLDRFLAELEIVCNVDVDLPGSVVRASQMTQKTNQFNLTTRRFEIPDVTQFVERPDRALLVLDYADRFGSEGIVGVAMLDLADGRIVNFLMSCRVIGRKVEDRLLERAIDVFRQHGIRTVAGEFVPSRKNAMVSSFYDTHGFDLVREEEDGRKIYERTVA